MEYINYYGLEKYIFSREKRVIYFIPYEFKSGTYKIDQIDYLKYDSDDFQKLDESVYKDILAKYMMLSVSNNYITNGSSCFLVEDINNLDITYKKLENKELLWEIINCNNSDNFYRYIDKDSEIYWKIVDESVNHIYELIINKLEKDYSNREISKLFLDYYASEDILQINCTIVCKEDIDKVLKKYNCASYEEYFEQKYKGLKLFRRFVSYKTEYENEVVELLSNSGNYDFDKCVYKLDEDNFFKVISYYTSFQDYEDDNFCNNFINVICCKVREKLIDNLDAFKLAKSFEFHKVSQWD